MENAEVWRNIKGYPDYQVSNLGRIWNARTNHYLKPSKMKSGYYQVNLVAINGKRKKELVHRLVALTFIPNPNNYPEVEHKDRDRGNNTISNLAWVNRSMNNRNTKQNRMVAVYKNGELIKECCITEASEIIGCSRSSIYSYFYRNQKYLMKEYEVKFI